MEWFLLLAFLSFVPITGLRGFIAGYFELVELFVCCRPDSDLGFTAWHKNENRNAPSSCVLSDDGIAWFIRGML